MTLTALLRRVKAKSDTPGRFATAHGFRSSFATWAEEETDYPDGVREAALAHKYKSETTAAYQRGKKLGKRRALMQDWANFLANEVGGLARPRLVA